MGGWWRNLDRILRGEATRPSLLARGTIDIQVGGLTVVLLILAMTYGASMGIFSLFRPGGTVLQLFASTLKVPALFALTLLVTLPSLYVSNALVGSRLTVDVTLRLLVAALGVMLAVLGALGPIVAFFSLSTSLYAFALMMNVAAFAASGLLGCLFLLQTLQRLSLPPAPPEVPLVPDEPVGAAARGDAASLPPPAELMIRAEAKAEGVSAVGPLDPLEGQVLHRHVKTIFRCWVFLFGLVGAQMGWVLRPFLGNPAVPFAWFRPRESNFFQAVWQAFVSLVSPP